MLIKEIEVLLMKQNSLPGFGFKYRNLKKSFQILTAFHFWLTSQREINVLSFTFSLSWYWQILWPKSHGFSGNISPWELTGVFKPSGRSLLFAWMNSTAAIAFYIMHEDKCAAVVDYLQWWHPSIHMPFLLVRNLLPLTLNLALALVSTNTIWQTRCCTNSRVKALGDLTVSIFTLWESSNYVEMQWGCIWRLRLSQLPATLNTWPETPNTSANPCWTF